VVAKGGESNDCEASDQRKIGHYGLPSSRMV